MSGASRALGKTQLTLSRQMTALEASLGVMLVDRGARASVLTAQLAVRLAREPAPPTGV